MNKEGGLLEHSIGVAETLLQLRAALAPDISEESCVIVGLFHDVGKVGMPGKPYYLPEVKNGMPTGAYTINPEIVAMGLSLRSLYLVSQYIPLSDAEAQAIAYHDGMYVPEGRSVAHKEEPLLLLLHWGMWDGEREGEVKEISIRVEDLIFNESILVFMERTIAISDDVYRGLLRMRSNRSFSEILSNMIWRKGNLKTLEIGFGTRDSKEKEILKIEIKNVEEEFQKWI